MSPSAQVGGSDASNNPYRGADVASAMSIFDSRVRLLTGNRQASLKGGAPDEDADLRMAKSIAAAVVADGNSIVRHVRSEQVDSHDHGFALQMQNAEKSRRPMDLTNENLPPAQNMPDDEEKRYLAQLAGRYVSRDACVALMPDELLRVEYQASGSQDLRPTHTCVICNDNKFWFDSYPAPCGDDCCGDCLQELFSASFKDESLFPPKCCRQIFPIDSKAMRPFLNKDLLDKYAVRKVELETTDRTYCHSCSEFILPTKVEYSLAPCSKCNSITCARCKSASHTGPCKNDEGIESVLALARDQQWQRCYKCMTMVSLSTGCNHMTCRCGAEFCYVCAAKWRTCQCIRFDEHRLLERAEVIINRDPAPRAETAERRQERVRRMVAVIEEHHECDHPREVWRMVPGPHHCEHCAQTLPRYILECGRCYIRACRRCRQHRIL